jgi:hypothetical protein
MIKSNRPSHIQLILLAASLLTTVACLHMTAAAQRTKRKFTYVFLDLKETNLDKPSTVAKNTISERLAAGGFKVTTKRREASVVVEGSISSRMSPVTDEVKSQGGVNAEAVASVRLLAGSEVIAAAVERSAPGDWDVQAERVGEVRLIEVADRIADDLFSGNVIRKVAGPENVSVIEVGASGNKLARDEVTIVELDAPPSSDQGNDSGIESDGPAKSSSHRVKKKGKPSKARHGMTFMEVVWLVQNYTPEDRIKSALRKYGIKFKPLDSAVSELRSAGASEAVINAVKTSTVV